MTEREKHDYLCFDRFLQVVGTKYEDELVEIEKKYYNNEINGKKFNEMWNEIINKILKEK